MKIIWTRSKLPLSVLIRWFLDSDCSHEALVFKAEDGGLMFESNLLGTHPKFFKSALKYMVVVHEIELPITVEQENAIWDLIVDKYDGSGYNYAGFSYFCWRAILLKMFKIPLPKKNPWSVPGTYLCEEIAKVLQSLSNVEMNVDFSMISPQNSFEYLKEWTKNVGL